MTLTLVLAIVSAANIVAGLLSAYVSPRDDVRWIANMLGGLWLMLITMYLRLGGAA